MKNVLNFLKLVVSFMGITSAISGLRIYSIDVNYQSGSKFAVVTITFDNLTLVTTTIMQAVIDLIESHEHVVSSAISGDIMTVSVQP